MRPAAYTAICASVAPERCSTTSVPSSHRNTATPSSCSRRPVEPPLRATAAAAEPLLLATPAVPEPPLPATAATPEPLLLATPAAAVEPPLSATCLELPGRSSKLDGRSPARRTFLDAKVWRPTLSTA